MRQVQLPGTGTRIPVIGQGAWRLGLSRGDRTRAVEALRLGFSLGMTLVDTAELYEGGRSEEVVGDAIHDCRDRVFVVTKVWPSHASRAAVHAAVRGSLRRLRTDYLDAVLLHWPTRSVPLQETLGAFAELRAGGVVRHFGISNFGGNWLTAADVACPPEERIAFHQVPYSLGDRRAERRVLPHARARGQVVMAYSPLGRGRARHWPGFAVLRQVAAARGCSPQQVALAWVVGHDGVVAIPKAIRAEHVRDNAAAGDWQLTSDERARLEEAFPVSHRPLPALPPRQWFFALAFGVIGLASRMR